MKLTLWQTHTHIYATNIRGIPTFTFIWIIKASADRILIIILRYAWICMLNASSSIHFNAERLTNDFVLHIYRFLFLALSLHTPHTTTLTRRFSWCLQIDHKSLLFRLIWINSHEKCTYSRKHTHAHTPRNARSLVHLWHFKPFGDLI